MTRETKNGGEPPKVKTKNRYSLLKHSKQDSSGIAPLRKDGQTLLTETSKANALNDQFQSVFSPKTPHKFKVPCPEVTTRFARLWCLPPIPGQFPPKMPDISITAEGIDKLLGCLNPHKAAGPDKFKPIVLQTLHKELAPILQLIFQRSLDTGKLPDIWKEANVSPIFKKEEKSDTSNYRPISMTCVLCKVL